MATCKGYEELGGDATGNRVLEAIKADYKRAGRVCQETGDAILDEGAGAWPWRTLNDIKEGLPVEIAIAKHRREWCGGLGIEVPILEEAPKATWAYRGNMCGIRVPGLPPIQGGAPDPSLALSWFYPFYNLAERQAMRDGAKNRSITDWQLSWPDARARGLRPIDFAASCMELATDGFMPTVYLLSKDFDPRDFDGCFTNAMEITPWLTTPRRCSRMSIGWELSLWLSPEVVQQLVDQLTPHYLAAGIETYVHLQQGYSHFDFGPDTSFPHYWNKQRGKLHGLMHQRDLSWNQQEYRWRLEDILRRFAGGFNTSTDNGIDGRPFRCIAFEITAWNQFNQNMSEDEGNSWGRVALEAHEGDTYCAGSGNGQ